MTVNIGDLAPNFELPDTELKMRTLDEFKGKKIVLSFIGSSQFHQYAKLNYVLLEIPGKKFQIWVHK